MSEKLQEPIILPCGLVLNNRLAKAATTEQMSDGQKLPRTDAIRGAYGHWAEGGWGLILTGNVQVDLRFLGAPNDTAIDRCLPESSVIAAYKEFATICSREGTPAIMQINHPGRQSLFGSGNRGFFEKTLAPSAVPIDFGRGILQRTIAACGFGTPSAMTVRDIDDVVERFAYAARIASETGFAGIQLHAAHGYLLSQFLSARTNLRTDDYGGSALARAKIVLDIVAAVRKVVPPKFCVAIKLNSVDHQFTPDISASPELRDVLVQAEAFTTAGVDFIELSGGSYENPVMISGTHTTAASRKTLERESFFLEFAKAIRRELPSTILMVTGGFRSRSGMGQAIADGSCDIIGLARPAILNPSIPKNILLNSGVPDEEAKVDAPTISTPWLLKQIGVKALGAGAETVSTPLFQPQQRAHSSFKALVYEENEEDGAIKILKPLSCADETGEHIRSALG